ncbi:hypothetical protein AZ66_06570 [Paenibacillus sp. E194]|nr:hypothetical protein AZ66_06570 [Paenibacillus sp. E194]
MGIHPVHRRLAELHLVQQQRPWTDAELTDLIHCMRINANLVQRLDSLKQLSQHAYEMNDTDWLHEICSQIEKLQASMDAF